MCFQGEIWVPQTFFCTPMPPIRSFALSGASDIDRQFVTGPYGLKYLLHPGPSESALTYFSLALIRDGLGFGEMERLRASKTIFCFEGLKHLRYPLRLFHHPEPLT